MPLFLEGLQYFEMQFSLFHHMPRHEGKRQAMYRNIALTRVRVTIVAVEKQ
jgi:hypothetical protein